MAKESTRREDGPRCAFGTPILRKGGLGVSGGYDTIPTCP